MIRETSSTERWKPIPGYEDLYEVSTLGRVRSLDRYIATATGQRLTRGVVMRLQGGDDQKLWRYYSVGLSRHGKKSRHSVHRLVLQAFVGPCPDGMEACHNNGDYTDNRLANLRWDTKAENGADKIQHRTHCARGHEYTSQSTRIDRNGHRVCRKCETPLSVERTRRRRAAAREARRLSA